MTTVEQEIIDKFRSLDKEAQKRVRAAIESAADEDFEMFKA